MKVPKALQKLIDQWLKTKGPETHSEDEELTCALCDNAQWWADNGFSEAERRAFCGPGGLNCPGFETEG